MSQPTSQASKIQTQTIILQPIQSTSVKTTKIKMTAKTWTKDSYGLFDYQAKTNQIIEQVAFLDETTYILRNNVSSKCQTIFVKNLQDLQIKQRSRYTLLGQLCVDRSRQNPSYKLKPEISKIYDYEQNYNSNKVPFVFVEGPTKNGYHLKPGNVIKFGRIQYLVIQSNNGQTVEIAKNSTLLQDSEVIFEVEKNRPIQVQDGQEQVNCKICLCNEDTQQDPLISPCKCKGYCGMIHTHCLGRWINNKVKKQTTGQTVSYNFTKFQCQICKSPFPLIIRSSTHTFQMMSIVKPSKPYIVLQSLDPSKQNKYQRLLHVISIDQKCPIHIGRGNQCQIRLTDISVSRKHAQINLEKGQFFIVNMGAKFGTLVGWNRDQLVNRRKQTKIQLGRTFYQFVLQQQIQQPDTQ